MYMKIVIKYILEINQNKSEYGKTSFKKILFKKYYEGANIQDDESVRPTDRPTVHRQSKARCNNFQIDLDC